MKAPDKIYLASYRGETFSNIWTRDPIGWDTHIEYINEDILLEWAKDDGLKERADKGDAWAIGYRCAMRDLIEKINSL